MQRVFHLFLFVGASLLTLLPFLRPPIPALAGITMFVEDDVDDPRFREAALDHPWVKALSEEFSFLLFRLRRLRQDDFDRLPICRATKDPGEWALPSFSPTTLQLNPGREHSNGARLFYEVEDFAGLEVQLSDARTIDYVVVYFRVDEHFLPLNPENLERRLDWDIARFRKLEATLNTVRPLQCGDLLDWTFERESDAVFTTRPIRRGERIARTALRAQTKRFSELPRNALRDISLFAREDLVISAARTIGADQLLTLEDIELPPWFNESDIPWNEPHQVVTLAPGCCLPPSDDAQYSRGQVLLRCRDQQSSKEAAGLLLDDLFIAAALPSRAPAQSVFVRGAVPIKEAFLVREAGRLGLLDVHAQAIKPQATEPSRTFRTPTTLPPK